MAIGTNTTLVENAADRRSPTSRTRSTQGQVALNGDPREAGAAFAAVMAASLANGGSFDDIMPGIQFFADLKASGNLIRRRRSTEASILSGETPIVLDWTYNFPGLQSQIEEAGFEVEVVVPVRRRVRLVLLPGRRGRRRRTRTRPSCGSSTSCPTKVRSGTSRVGPSRPATRRWSRPA